MKQGQLDRLSLHKLMALFTEIDARGWLKQIDGDYRGWPKQ